MCAVIPARYCSSTIDAVVQDDQRVGPGVREHAAGARGRSVEAGDRGRLHSRIECGGEWADSGRIGRDRVRRHQFAHVAEGPAHVRRVLPAGQVDEGVVRRRKARHPVVGGFHATTIAPCSRRAHCRPRVFPAGTVRSGLFRAFVRRSLGARPQVRRHPRDRGRRTGRDAHGRVRDRAERCGGRLGRRAGSATGGVLDHQVGRRLRHRDPRRPRPARSRCLGHVSMFRSSRTAAMPVPPCGRLPTCGVGCTSRRTTPTRAPTYSVWTGGWRTSTLCTTSCVTLRAEAPHGSRFLYRSAETDVLGWVCERAAGAPMPELVSSLVWTPLGAEHDGEFLTDADGTAVHDGGLAVTALDLLRFGLMLVDAAEVVAPGLGRRCARHATTSWRHRPRRPSPVAGIAASSGSVPAHTAMSCSAWESTARCCTSAAVPAPSA